ncbi:hypothetical protein, unlikely [Trypanosoma congolense IL3000]|uniref:Uncharacterized protein n=1 Tax=Trypanosoma congolense (strain IL3000) TaxID=1068625 RepID=F9WB72_TRYCI|nr:hypothetical protein, unlikely [Trypanosoma congolense IL3000]
MVPSLLAQMGRSSPLEALSWSAAAAHDDLHQSGAGVRDESPPATVEAARHQAMDPFSSCYAVTTFSKIKLGGKGAITGTGRTFMSHGAKTCTGSLLYWFGLRLLPYYVIFFTSFNAVNFSIYLL